MPAFHQERGFFIDLLRQIHNVTYNYMEIPNAKDGYQLLLVVDLYCPATHFPLS
ncbi:hypothetical protein GA0116948_103245 [Chitinophaga costaii]|uniref:Uncharacterized protein n=1 Tax=Chitinophaga costaii TaxID=1335309 RepID=A0A1C4BT54_9BACT|nr:hypothetical protein GA0116948_103245 [Chitinophaga costaii]